MKSSIELQQMSLDYLAHCGGNQSKAARDLGVARQTFCSRVSSAYASGLTSEPLSDVEGFLLNYRTTSAGRKLTRKQTKGAKKLGIDPAQLSHGWVKDEGRSYFFKVDRDRADEEEDIQAFNEGQIAQLRSGITPLMKVKKPSGTDSDLETRYVIADLHFSMLAHALEAGDHYDMKIAAKLAHAAVADLVASTPHSAVGIIRNLGDALHAHDSKNTTFFSGHQLDVDGRYSKIASTVTGLFASLIMLCLQKHERVDYEYVAGNHDPDQIHWLGIALQQRFLDNPRVSITINPAKKLVRTFGRNFIAAHHGDRVKWENLYTEFSSADRALWGQCDYFYCDTGHIHHEKERDVGLMKFRSFRTMSARDKHAADNGYVSPRSISAITVHKEAGEISEHHVQIVANQVRSKGKSA